MTFQEFSDQLIFFLTRDFGYDRDQLRSLPRGYEPANESEKVLIRDTNLRYFNRESDILLGNFIFANCSGFKPKDGGGEKSETVGERPGVPVRTFERLHLDALYDDCEKGGFESVLARLRRTRSEVRMAKASGALAHTDDYQRTKDSLIVRPLNFNAHHRTLKGCIYRRVGDIALVLYILFAHDKGRYISGRIPREALEKWGISENAAIDAALGNTERIHPATLAKLVRRPVRKAMATAYKPMGLLRELTESIEDTRLVSLSGRDNPNGAVSLFYPGVMELLFEKIGGPYYAAFIGLDGVVIHSVSQIDARTALESLKDTNTRYNRPEDVLSTHIYRYDGNSFEIVRI